MKTQDEKREVVPSFDDLVFEKRNKEYGAYTLRRKYNKSLLFSMLIGILFISATVITPFVIYEPTPVAKPVPIDSVAVEFTDLNLIVNQKIEQPKPIIEKAPVLDYSKPEVVENVSIEDAKKFLTRDDLNDNIKNDSATESKIEIKRIEIDPDINGKINEPFKVTEKPYFGIMGDSEFKTWISEHIIYPEAAIEANLQGRVYLQFVIEKDGSLSNIKVLKSIDPELDNEAVRVLQGSPNWNPGKIDGTPVRVFVYFPISFTLKTGN